MPALQNKETGDAVDSSSNSRQDLKLEQIYLKIGDQHERILSVLDLPLLDPSASLDQTTAFRLALITAFQFAEGLPDPVAAKATIARKDWKNALYLPVRHSGFSATALCKFRESLYFSADAISEFAILLECLGRIGLYDRVTMEALDAEEVLSTVCRISCYYQLNLAMKMALSCLVSNCPDWLRMNALPHWYERYKTGQLSQAITATKEEMQKEAIRIGKDMQHLLEAAGKQCPAGLSDQAEIRHITQLYKLAFTAACGQLSWRLPACVTCPCSNLGGN